MIKVKSLQQRLMLFLLLPVAALLIAEGIIGFFYARNSLLEQWREAAILKLQRAGHDVDMRLSRPKEFLEMYNKTGGEHFDDYTQEWILDQLRQLEGVDWVSLSREEKKSNSSLPHLHRERLKNQMDGAHTMSRREGMMHFHMARIAEITPPRYDSLLEHETVSIISELINDRGKTIGRLEVAVRFDYLMENLGTAGWWESNRAFLVDKTGKILVSTDPNRYQLGENGDPMEQSTLQMMQKKPSGTILGPGRPPKEVGGFYRLREADWTLILVAPGDEILAPILRFRNYYILSGSVFILFVLWLIRLVTGRTVSSIRDVSNAAEDVARGEYSSLPPARTQDEVGQLIGNFNTMVSQLKERMRLKQALDLAMEVQQSLLPGPPPEIKAFDLAGKSIYCDETGGDYYDFISFPGLGNGRLAVVVGDVAGHGIAPALLMTTVRALLRSRTTQPGSIADMITDVNRLLCNDTSETGNFMTLFFMLIDSENREIRWVRAGHEPAIVYDSKTDSFSELRGTGIVLGVDVTWSYQEHVDDKWLGGQIILIGTDGIWETENLQGERFGKQRLRDIIRENNKRTSEEILEAIFKSLTVFRQSAPQQDDITMVVVKKS
jgi:sigma-B regulation protein RsbU (phosphoserine phosphatase)